MTGLPQITVVGTLTGDPELRFIASGKAVASINVAANERKYNKDTNTYEDGDATFLRGSVWGKYGEHVAESLRKGDKVIVTGSLRQRSWEKDGVKRTTVELDVQDIGPALRFKTVTVNRNNGGLVGSSAPAAAGAWGGTDDAPGW